MLLKVSKLGQYFHLECLLQTIWVVADTLSSSKPKRFLQFWPAALVGTVYACVQAAYILNGGTNYQGLPYIYKGYHWDTHPGEATGKAAMAVTVTIGSHILLWALVLARDAVWRKLGLDKISPNNHPTLP